ncbi:MAG: hypothetical protein QMC67_09625 [Candidatus Wallbacteria bacterium]
MATFTAENFDEIINELKPVINERGFRFVSHNFIYLKRSVLFRALIDKTHKTDAKDGITHADCVYVSKLLQEVLERRPDLTDIEYSIELSSAGVTRAFSGPEDYKANLGIEIEFHVKEAINSHNSYYGIIKEINEQESIVSIEVTGMVTEKRKGPLKPGQSARAKKDGTPSIIGSVITLPIKEIKKASIKLIM